MITRRQGNCFKSAVIAAAYRLSPLCLRPRKICAQGNSDAWVEARYNQTEQMLVRYSMIDENVLVERYGDKDKIPPCMRKETLSNHMLHEAQVVYWDEIHLEQECGLPVHYNSVIYRIRRDDDGKISDKEGAFDISDIQKKIFKYPGQARLGAGVALTQNSDGVVKGKRADLFDYTGKTLCTKMTKNNVIKDEIRRVKSLKPKGLNSPWIEFNRPANVFWKGIFFQTLEK